MNKNIKKQKGFTLIEILVVIGIIAILAAVVLIAINPARQFAQARNSQRSSNVNAVLNAIGQYIADNKGNLPAGITDIAADIPSALCQGLLPEYMPALPTDPKSDFKGEAIVEADCGDLDTQNSKYEVVQDEITNRITISAPLTELKEAGDPNISVTR
jgi:type IV pilus assembly protein PilA